VRGLVKRAVADLRAEIVERCVDRADIGVGACDQILDRAILCRVQQRAAGRAARRVDLRHQPRKPRLVRAPRHDRVIAASGKAQRGIAANPGACADDEEHWLAAIGHGCLPSVPGQHGY